MTTARYAPALDGLRALAILLVIPHNANLYGDHPGYYWPLALLANAGWIGVQLFFVLSGFLITGGLLDTAGQPGYFRQFYLKRALRILPLYYVVLIVGLLAGPALIGQPPLTARESHGVPWLWLFLSNWVQPFGYAVPGFTHFWSLAVEEQFYLLWPLVVLACRRTSLARLCIALIVLAAVARVALTLAGLPAETSYVFTVCRMDALAAGALAAIAVRSPRGIAWMSPRIGTLAGWAAVALGTGALATGFYERHDLRTLTFGEPLLALAFALLIAVVALRSASRPPSGATPRWIDALSVAPLRAIGRYSYGMYVLHLPIVMAITAPAHRWLGTTGRAEPPLFALLATVLSMAAGAVSYHVLERHFLALKSRLTRPERGVRTSTVGDGP